MDKQRYYTTPSSLGSYFGVGFNSPQEQLDIDLGNIQSSFDDDAKARMLLGKVLEDSVLDYFEQTMDIKINHRNDKMIFFYDNKIKGIMDGMTIIDNIPTVVECKVSNAKSYVFTDNLGYVIQCHTYMLATDTKQCMLCGLYQGKPIYKIIKRDKQIIKDIKNMTDFVVMALTGLTDFNQYPETILKRYSETKILPEIKEMSDTEINDARQLITYKEQMKRLRDKCKEIEDRLKTNYDEGIYNNNDFKLTLSERTRKGGLDKNRLSIEHPEIDLKSYSKPSTHYKTLRVTKKD